VVTITLSGTGEYVLNQSITASWSATDALSGVVSPVSGSVSIDTNSMGTKTFTLPAGTAKDKAGNSSLIVTKSYSVIVDTEEPVIVDSEDPEMIYPQQWATGTGTSGDPWAGDCINDAYTACPAGGTIYLKAGYYTLSTTLVITKQVNLIGEGRNKTFIVTGMTTTNGILVYEDYCTLKGFTIDGDSQTDGTAYISPIGIGYCDYVLVEDVEVKNGGYYGINIYEVNHSLFQNIYAHGNYRHGLHSGSDKAGRNMYNTYRDIYAWDNGNLGFADRGNGQVGLPIEECHNVYDNLQCWDNGLYGIEIANQKGGVLSNSLSSGNTGIGISLLGLEDFNVNSCSATLNEKDGIYLQYSKNINLTNVIIKNNNLADNFYSGVRIKGCSNIALISCQSYDDRETPLQRYGLQLSENDTDISLLNCKLTPNSLGEIYNPAGVVITTVKWFNELSQK
jgi:parallel beta-helix repeat protein